MRASCHGGNDCVKSLIDAGADVNAIDNDGGTAVKWAESSQHIEAADILRKAGAKQ
jgi:ankyrin repeat protein